MIDWNALEALLELRDAANAATDRAEDPAERAKMPTDMRAWDAAVDARREFGMAAQGAAADLVRAAHIAVLAHRWQSAAKAALLKTDVPEMQAANRAATEVYRKLWSALEAETEVKPESGVIEL